MSTERYVDDLSTATLFGEVSSGSIQAEVQSKGILGGIEIGGVNQTIHPDILPATTERLGGIIVGDHLSITEEGLLSVKVANNVEGDNTNPITAAAVYTEVGNINALLQGI